MVLWEISGASVEDGIKNRAVGNDELLRRIVSAFACPGGRCVSIKPRGDMTTAVEEVARAADAIRK